MKRILLTVAYDGTGYSGFQAQKSGVPTIERELNRALTELTGVETEVSGAHSSGEVRERPQCPAAGTDLCAEFEGSAFGFPSKIL